MIRAMKIRPWPKDLFEPATRSMFLFAHQDDEAAYGGLIQRVSPASQFLWVTNGDGLAREAGMDAREYAAARRLETEAAMHALGVEGRRLRFLGHSEVEIYQALVRVEREPERRHEVFGMFRSILAQVTAEVRAFRPDVVFTLAWQGGHPEHDLTHLFARLAIRDRPEVRLFELPEYELAWTVLLRFPPWRRAEVHELRLTPDEAARKRAALALYPTQERLLRQFERLLALRGLVEKAVSLGREDLGVLEREYFAPVPAERDYTQCPHGLDRLEYLGDDCDGVRISFRRMIAPIVQALC